MTLLVIELRMPAPASIHSAADLWTVLWNAVPIMGAFLLSFTIIFITWVNHHAVIRSIPRTSATFLFANGFLLLAVAWILVSRSALRGGLGSRRPSAARPAAPPTARPTRPAA